MSDKITENEIELLENMKINFGDVNYYEYKRF